MRTVKIRLNPDTGEMNIEVNGAPGGTCKDLTRGLEEKVGKVAAREDTPEAFEEALSEQYVQQEED